MMDLADSIVHLGLADSVPGLRTAMRRSQETTDRMRAALSDFDASETMDVVAFGSLARQEYTTASDVDYLVLVDGTPPDPAAPRALLRRIKECVAAEAMADDTPKAPGTSGLFGRATGIFDIINQVGLEGDTNSTHTVRMEIIQESISLLNDELHARIMENTLGRYITLFDVPLGSPPRFLLNDMLRYWRQITVDYQAKAPVGGEEPKAVLRYLKLLTTRKNFIASSILPLMPRATAQCHGRATSKTSMRSRLWLGWPQLRATRRMRSWTTFVLCFPRSIYSYSAQIARKSETGWRRSPGKRESRTTATRN